MHMRVCCCAYGATSWNHECISVTWLSHARDVWDDVFIGVTWFSEMIQWHDSVRRDSMRHDSDFWENRDMTHLYVWCDSVILGYHPFICGSICGMCCVRYECLCQIWMFYVKHRVISYECDMNVLCQIWMRHVRCVVYITHSSLSYDSFMCVTHSCETWLIHVCRVTHPRVWHDSFMCVTWLIHICDMTHSYVRHDSFICVRHDSSMFVALTYPCVWLIHMCDMTH